MSNKTDVALTSLTKDLEKIESIGKAGKVGRVVNITFNQLQELKYITTLIKEKIQKTCL